MKHFELITETYPSKSPKSIEMKLSFTGALTILFVGLKLTSVITWPWLWVLSPMLIDLAIAGLIIAIAGLVFVISKLVLLFLK